MRARAQRSLPPAIGHQPQRECRLLQNQAAAAGGSDTARRKLQTPSTNLQGNIKSQAPRDAICRLPPPSAALAVTKFLERNRLRANKLDEKRGKDRPPKPAYARIISGGMENWL